MRVGLYRGGLLGLALGVLVLAHAEAATAATGSLAQKPGAAGCISETPSLGLCGDGVALFGEGAITVSPDGKSAYVTSELSDAVAVFDRDPATGELTQKAGTAGCISEDGTSGFPNRTPGACADGVALDGAFEVAVSPDSKSVYVASLASDAVAVFDRDATTGALTQKPGTAGCISDDGSGGACTDGVALWIPSSVTVSPDGTGVYVTSYGSDAVAVFDRDATTGELTQKPGTAGCISVSGAGPCAQAVALVGPQSLALSADGNNAYVATAGFVNGLPPLFNDALVVFDRNPTTGELTQKPGTAGCITKGGTSGYPDYAPGACGDGVALVGPYRVSVSPDGRSAYVASIDSGVAVFDRNPTTGALTQKPGTAGCISNNGFGGACAEAVALDRPSAVTLSPDGKNAYVPSRLSDAVAGFDRDPTTGELTQKPGTAGCISEDGTSGFPDNTPGDCTDGVALDRPSSLAVSFDGKNAYVASEFDGGGAVAVFDRQTPGPPYGELGSATAKKTQKQKGKKIVVKVKVKANEDLTAKATGKVKVKKKSYKLKLRTRSVNSGQSTNLKLKPKKSKDVKTIAKALKRGKKATAKLTVKLTNEADNTKTNKLKVKLKR